MSTAGLIDTTFPIGLTYGFDKDVHDIKIQYDGRILLSGDFDHYDYDGNTYLSPYLLRLNTDGTFDTSFDILLSGSGLNGEVRTIHILSDGKILVGGLFTQLNQNGSSYVVNRIVKLNSNGSIDTSFSGGTGFNDEVSKIEVQTDGKILVGGKFTQYDGQSYNRIIRLNLDGTIDPTFIIGTGIDGVPPANYVNDVLLQSDGKILLAGHFEDYNGTSVSGIVRLLTNGDIDPSFNSGTGLNGFATSIGIQSTGHIILGGIFTNYNGTDLSFGNIVKINSDGSFSDTFGFGLDIAVTSILIQSDDKIIVGGAFTKYYTSLTEYITAKKLIKFLPNTNIDNNFYLNPNYDDVFLGLALTPNDGYLYVGGDTNYPPFNHFAKLINEALVTTSANTEYFMCSICTGDTETLSVPHAIYSDGFGRNVVQLNTVALGGPNGLNN